MLLDIPFFADARWSAPFHSCIRRAADETGRNEFEVAIVMSYFFQELTEQVAMNRVVRIPGIGVFGVKLYYPRNDPHALGRTYPAFSGSSAFRNYVATCCPPIGAAVDAIDRHRRHNHPSSRPDRSTDRPHTALRAFRERVRAQGRRIGIEVYDGEKVRQEAMNLQKAPTE